MPDLPDGTTVTSQKVEGWNINPPSGLTNQYVEGWDIDPPPVAGLSINAEPESITPGGEIDVSGTVTRDGSPAGGVTVTLTMDPAGPDTPDPTTDGNGDYMATLGPFETPGDYDVTAEVNGIEEQITEGWNT
jgi:hypothetical protein